jgi:hypothetical protein
MVLELTWDIVLQAYHHRKLSVIEKIDNYVSTMQFE